MKVFGHEALLHARHVHPLQEFRVLGTSKLLHQLNAKHKGYEALRAPSVKLTSIPVQSLIMSMSFHMPSAPATRSTVSETADSGSSDSIKRQWEHKKTRLPQ